MSTIDDETAKTLIAAYGSTPRAPTDLDATVVLRVQVAGVVHTFYQYGWDYGDNFTDEYVPGLYCETPNGQFKKAQGYVPIYVERIAPASEPVTCLFCIHEDHRLRARGY